LLFTIIEHVEGFCGLGEDAVGFVGIGMLEGWMVIEGDLAISE
jgi:hypothetical protein